MSGIINNVRNEVFNALNGHEFLTSVQVIKSYETFENVTDLTVPEIVVCGMNAEMNRQTRNGNGVGLLQVPVSVTVQAVCNFNNLAAVDSLVELVEQVQDVCSNVTGWFTNRPATDLKGQPFNFKAKKNGIFFANFTAYYSVRYTE